MRWTKSGRPAPQRPPPSPPAVELAMWLSSAAGPAQGASPPRSPEPLQPRAQAVLQPRAAAQPRPASHPRAQARQTPARRLVVVDGMNVAMAHGLHREFSAMGLVLAYEYFRKRGNQVRLHLTHHLTPPDSSWNFT